MEFPRAGQEDQQPESGPSLVSCRAGGYVDTSPPQLPWPQGLRRVQVYPLFSLPTNGQDPGVHHCWGLTCWGSVITGLRGSQDQGVSSLCKILNTLGEVRISEPNRSGTRLNRDRVSEGLWVEGSFDT